LVEDYYSCGAGGIEIRLILKESKVEDKKMIIALLYCTSGFVWTLRYASRRVEVIKYTDDPTAGQAGLANTSTPPNGHKGRTQYFFTVRVKSEG
jgi:hypothetical protein